MKRSGAVFSRFSNTIEPVALEAGGGMYNGRYDERETDCIKSEWKFVLCMS